jgi:hypothetical protein
VDKGVIAMPTKDYPVKTTQRRWLALAKLDDGNYQMKVMFGDNTKPIATLVFTPTEWTKLASYSEGLKRK